jgi:hypothetical protein
MIKTLLLAMGGIVALAVAAILIMAAAKSDTFEVRRSASIKAPPEKIFPLIDDFHRWGQWSPYEKLDPGMQRSFSEPASGKGATYAWKSDGQAGVGSMQITEASAPSRVALDLNFVKPFETRNTVEFSLQPSGDATLVTWSMRGPRPYLAKVMHVIFDMDKMVGGDFETGLADLKAVAER